jgi:Spy/CpxP family protein refolding chaperone
MRSKVFIIALAALLVVGTISIAFSRGGGRRSKGFGAGLGRGPGIVKQTPEELNLSQEQQEKLQALRTDFTKEALPLRNEIQIKSLELRQLWIADELDEEAIVAKSQEISALRNQLQEKMIRHRLDAAKILTTEQRIKFSPVGHWGHGGRGGHHGMDRGHRWRW